MSTKSYYPIVNLPIGTTYIATILGPLVRQHMHWLTTPGTKDRSVLCLESIANCPHCPGERKHYGYLHAFGTYMEDGQHETGEVILCLTPRTADELEANGGDFTGQILSFFRKSVYSKVRIEVSEAPSRIEIPQTPINVKAYLMARRGVSQAAAAAPTEKPDVIPFRKAN